MFLSFHDNNEKKNAKLFPKFIYINYITLKSADVKHEHVEGTDFFVKKTNKQINK